MQELDARVTNTILPSQPIINWVHVPNPSPRFYNRKSEFLQKHQAIELYSTQESSVYSRIFGLRDHQPTILVYDWTRDKSPNSHYNLLTNIIHGEIQSDGDVLTFKPPHLIVFAKIIPDTKYHIKKSYLNIIHLDNIE